VTLDASGNLYGDTAGGGTYGSGVVFELMHTASAWQETVLYNFCSQQNCSDGGLPIGALVMDHSGNLYGTAHVAFELVRGSDGWSEEVLHSFDGHGDGFDPGAGLVRDADGSLFGTTAEGGTGCPGQGCGTVFELTQASGSWSERMLHRFDNNGKDGVEPGNGALLMDGSGNLYGTTSGGGANSCGALQRPGESPGRDIGNCGTLYKLTKKIDGRWSETILYNFKSGSTGDSPFAGVVMDTAGNLYGTTDIGGATCGCGVVYKLAPQGKGKWKYRSCTDSTTSTGPCPLAT
jgi:uncharacterized repeat protein (TIGR03803 family)